ncbi:hypothetical protein JCM5353_003850 [Sporobolomyces roseus]
MASIVVRDEYGRFLKHSWVNRASEEPNSKRVSSLSSDSWPSSSPSPSSPNPPTSRLVSLSPNSSSTIDTLNSSPGSNSAYFSPSPLKRIQTSNWVLSNAIAVPLSSPFCSALSQTTSPVIITTMSIADLSPSFPLDQQTNTRFASSLPHIPSTLFSSPTRASSAPFGIFLDPPSPTSSSSTEILPIPSSVPKTINPKLLSLPCVYPHAIGTKEDRVIVLRSRKVEPKGKSVGGKGIRRRCGRIE